jgi:hypothetical protein
LSQCSHMDRQEVEKHSQCKDFKNWQLRIYSIGEYTISKSSRETSQWQFQCLRYTAGNYLTCLTTTNNWRFLKTRHRRFRFKGWKSNLFRLNKKSLTWFSLVTVWEPLMQLKQMIHHLEVTLFARLRYKKKALNSVGSCY